MAPESLIERFNRERQNLPVPTAPDAAPDKRSDAELVKLASNGNPDAFSELVGRHRSKALAWAKAITTDAYAAEDIVQDALIRSFLHLGTLADGERFLPWLRTIIRNQAFSYLRKTDNSARVQPFTSLMVNAHDEYHLDAESIDSVIGYLAHRTERPVDLASDPLEQLTRKDLLQSITLLLGSLSPRARHIFEAHFFRQLPPDEIALLFRTSTANVYNTISRAKTKMLEERFKQEVNRHLCERRLHNMPSKRRLAAPGHETAYTSMAVSLNEALKYTACPGLSLTEVMAITGEAFRLNLAPDCGPSSAFIYDWGHVTRTSLASLGSSAACVGRPDAGMHSAQALIDALKLVQESIDRGIPAIAWNLSSAEFSLIYGYDDERKMLMYRDVSRQDIELPYERLGRNNGEPELFVAAIIEDKAPSGFKQAEAVTLQYRKLLVGAARMAIAQATGRQKSAKRYVGGLAAYDCWINAILSGQADPIGHAYNIAIAAEARSHAVRFFRTLRWEDAGIQSLEAERFARLKALATIAADRYGKAFESFRMLYPSFPYSGVTEPEYQALAVRMLTEAKNAEQAAVHCLQTMIRLLEPDEAK